MAMVKLKRARPPIMSPAQMADELRCGIRSGVKKFTSKADLEVVVELYRAGFVQVFEDYVRARPSKPIFYQNVGWADEHVRGAQLPGGLGTRLPTRYLTYLTHLTHVTDRGTHT